MRITKDGRNVIVFMSEGLFFFDNIIGKLIWKDTTGWDKWGGSLRSKSEGISEHLGLIAVKWSAGIVGKGRKKKRFYILNFQGERIWESGLNLADGKLSIHSNRFLIVRLEKINDDWIDKYSFYRIAEGIK